MMRPAHSQLWKWRRGLCYGGRVLSWSKHPSRVLVWRSLEWRKV